MSGGSFNYLCHKDATKLLSEGMDDLKDMAVALGQLGYAEDASQATSSLFVDISIIIDCLDRRIERLVPIWTGMEWWQSADRSENSFKRALAEFRGTELPTCSRCAGSGREPKSTIGCRNPGCANGKDVSHI